MSLISSFVVAMSLLSCLSNYLKKRRRTFSLFPPLKTSKKYNFQTKSEEEVEKVLACTEDVVDGGGGYARVSRGIIFYKYFGVGGVSDELPLVVICHGFMGSSNDVSYLAEVICAMRRVLVFDLIGTNNSVSTHNHLDDAVFYASSLAELLLVLGEDKPIDLIGFSMGGGVTSKFAALYPKSINSLVQIAP